MDLLAQQLTDLLACAYAQLSIKPCRKFIHPGLNPAIDNCEVGYGEDGEMFNGQLWVAATSITPNWPNPNPEPSPCPTQYTAVIELGIARCTPTQDDDGNPPPEEDVTDSAYLQLQDRWELLESILCCLADEEKDYVFNQWIAQPPQGGCAVSAWTFKLRLGGCQCQGLHS